MDLSAEEIHPFIDLDSSIIPGTGLLANAMHKLHIRYDSSQIKRIQMERAQMKQMIFTSYGITSTTTKNRQKINKQTKEESKKKRSC